MVDYVREIKKKMDNLAELVLPFLSNEAEDIGLSIPFVQSLNHPPVWVLTNTPKTISYAEHLLLESLSEPQIDFHFLFTDKESLPYKTTIYIHEIDSNFTSDFIPENTSLIQAIISSECVIVALGYRFQQGGLRISKLVPVYIKHEDINALERCLSWIDTNNIQAASSVAKNYAKK